MTKVTITSDGTHPGTRVSIDGTRINGITEIRWCLKTGGLAEVTLKLSDIELDVDGQMAMKFEGPGVVE